MTDISKFDELIDSRDVIERIETLESELALFLDETEGALPENFPNIDELSALRALAEECSSLSADWEYGEMLVRYSYWQDYVQEMLEDCGEIPRNLPWYISIDWEKTADNISQDYTLVDFDGVDYYIRNI